MDKSINSVKNNLKIKDIYIISNDTLYLKNFKHKFNYENENYNFIIVSNENFKIPIYKNFDFIPIIILDLDIYNNIGLNILDNLLRNIIWYPLILINNNQKINFEMLEEFGYLFMISKFAHRDLLMEKIKIIIDKFNNKLNLFGIDFISVIKLIELIKKTGLMIINNNELRGYVFFKDGIINNFQIEGLNIKSADDLKTLLNLDIRIIYINHFKKNKFEKTKNNQLEYKENEIKINKIVDKNFNLDNSDFKEEVIKFYELQKSILKRGLISSNLYYKNKNLILVNDKKNIKMLNNFLNFIIKVKEIINIDSYKFGNYCILNLSDNKFLLIYDLETVSAYFLIDGKEIKLGYLINIFIPSIKEFVDNKFKILGGENESTKIK